MASSSSDLAKVDHLLEVRTSGMMMVRRQLPELDLKIVLVDTPGFDVDSSDINMLITISVWLTEM